MNPTLKGKNTS